MYIPGISLKHFANRKNSSKVYHTNYFSGIALIRFHQPVSKDFIVNKK